jgi:hypothetical protein
VIASDSKFAGFAQASTYSAAARGSNAPYRYNAEDFEEIKEDSLTRLKQTHSGSK